MSSVNRLLLQTSFQTVYGWFDLLEQNAYQQLNQLAVYTFFKHFSDFFYVEKWFKTLHL